MTERRVSDDSYSLHDEFLDRELDRRDAARRERDFARENPEAQKAAKCPCDDPWLEWNEDGHRHCIQCGRDF